MLEYKTLTLIGTSHISPASVREVKKKILAIEPAFVAVELDKNRLHALLQKKKRTGPRFSDIRQVGVRGFLFAIFGAWVEARLGKMVGTKPGGEMKAAIFCAAKIKAKVVLIDQDIRVTIKRLFAAITWREKGRFVWDIVRSPFAKKELVQFDLRKVPPEELIDKLVLQVKDRYPSVYNVLIHERNVFMARKLVAVMKKHPEDSIVAVVGAGHEKDMMKLIQKAISS